MWCNPPSSICILRSVLLFLSGAGYEDTHSAAYPTDREPLHPMLVVEEVHVQRREQRRSEIFEIQFIVHVSFADGGPQEPEHGRAAPVVGGIREALQPVSPAQRLVAAVEQIQVLRGEVDERAEECVELLQSRRVGFSQYLQRLLLQTPRGLVEEGLAQIALVGESPVERTFSDTRRPRHLLHRDARDAALLKKHPRRVEDYAPVAR